MEQEEIFNLIQLAERQMLDLSNSLANLKKQAALLIEENNQLRMANHDLHDMLMSQSQLQAQEENRQGNSETQYSVHHPQGSSRLQAYYDEGIHVCHQYFGARRHLDEECIFCQGVLDEMAQGQPR